MNNIEKYRERVALLNIFEIGPDFHHIPLNEIYLVPISYVNNVRKLTENKFYNQIKNLQQIQLYFNCISMYDLNCFGYQEDERILLESKTSVLKTLHEVLGNNWDAKSLWEHIDSPYCKSIIGTLYYYGLGRSIDQLRGEELLIEAANLGDSDALLWCLWKYPEKAHEYMEQLVSLPESLASPKWLDPWREYYNLWDVKEKNIVKYKIGFSI